MGNMIDLAIIKNCDKTKIKMLFNYWMTRQGCYSYIKPEDCCYSQQNDAIVVLLNHGSCLEGHDGFFYYVSKWIAGVVLAIYVYDSDYWGYTLYDAGKEMDEFCTCPEEMVSDDATKNDLRKYSGNSAVISRYFQVSNDAVKHYLVPWTAENGGVKAYPDDEYEAHDDWQILDFMAKLGYEWPGDESEYFSTAADINEISLTQPVQPGDASAQKPFSFFKSILKLFNIKTTDMPDIPARLTYSIQTDSTQYTNDEMTVPLINSIIIGLGSGLYEYIVLTPNKPVRACTFLKVSATVLDNTNPWYIVQASIHPNGNAPVLYCLHTEDKDAVVRYFTDFWHLQQIPDISYWKDAAHNH